MQYRRGKKRRNSLNWLCFTAERSEDSSTQRLHHVKISRQSSHLMTSCPPADHCSICGLYFWWFWRDSQNSTWATGPFIIYQLNYSCLGCSVSWRKTKPSIIWPCHSFISYSILQLILKPALYLLIYLTSLYFWWWRPPIVHITVFLLP